MESWERRERARLLERWGKSESESGVLTGGRIYRERERGREDARKRNYVS